MDEKQVNEFRKKQLDEINGYRKVHGAPALVLDPVVCRDAQAWAEHLAATATLTHQKNPKYGENIACGYPLSSLNPAKMWYSEVRNIRSYKNLESNTGCFHFSQVVWNSSKKLGIGVAVSPVNGMGYIVANFEPRGNVLGSFDKNVFPPKTK